MTKDIIQTLTIDFESFVNKTAYEVSGYEM